MSMRSLMRRWLWLPLWLAGATVLLAQSGSVRLENVDFAVTAEDQIQITYDLVGGEGLKFDVSFIFLRDTGGAITPRTLSGDCGSGVSGGRNRRALWDVLSDIPKLDGNYTLRVVATYRATDAPAPAPTPRALTPRPSEPTPRGRQPARPTPPPADTATMVKIDGGSFNMGCVVGDAACAADEKPSRRVSVDAFWMDRHEVTAAEYSECVQSGVCRLPQTSRQDQLPPSFTWNNPGHHDHPINGVTWNDAAAYCRWRNKRLPTEAEFEFALRGGFQGYIYPWGLSTTPPYNSGNYSDEDAASVYSGWQIFVGYSDGCADTAPVCTFAANPFGLCDISGNVTEWVQDWYDAGWYNRMPDRNPLNETGGSGTRVFRGGGWRHYPAAYRNSQRGYLQPDDWSNDLGFRCVR